METMKKKPWRPKILCGASSLFALLFLAAGPAPAGIPLVSDDTGTQGKRNWQLEFSYEYDHCDYGGVSSDAHLPQLAVTYGLGDSLDVILTFPYLLTSTDDGHSTVRNTGIGDITLNAKWRFYEADGLSLAIKPGLSMPTGNDDEGRGNGEFGYGGTFIVSKAMDPFVFHFNAGYNRADNTQESKEDIWHFSLAGEYPMTKWFKLVADIGISRYCGRDTDTPPAFILGGVSVSPLENLDVGAGIKGGLTETEADYSLITGVTLRF